MGSGKVQAQDNWEVERVEMLNEIVQLLSQSAGSKKADSLLHYFEKQAKAHDDSAAVIKVYIARINSNIDNQTYIDSVLDLLQLMLPACSEREKIEYQIDRSYAASIRGDYPLQILHLDSATVLAEQLGDSVGIYETLVELSLAYQNVNNYEAALQIAHRARSYLDANRNQYYEAYSLRNLGVCHDGLQQSDSAIMYADSALQEYKEIGNDQETMFTQAVTGKFLANGGKYAEALKLLQPAADSLFAEGSPSRAIGAYNQVLVWLAETYLALGDLPKAREASFRAYQMAEQLEQVIEQIEALKILISAILSREPGAKAYFETYLTLQDSLIADQNQEAVLEFERKYQTKEAEQKVLLLEQEAIRSDIRIQNIRFIVFVVLALVLLLGLVAGVLILRSRIRTQQQIQKLNTKALQLQINPHFFFNVLNSISNYIGQNDAKSAHLYLSRFAKLMRITLESSRENLVHLESELQFLETYLELEQLRHDSFDIQIECDPALNEIVIPPLMIQPFVENAVVHAFNSPQQERGLIRILVTKQADFLEVKIEDNGIGMEARDLQKEDAKKSSLAIKILEERLTMYRRKKGSIRFEVPYPNHNTHPGTRVILKIPLNLGQ